VIEAEPFNTILSFQVDSGATVSVLNVNTYKKLNSPRLQKCDRILHAFGQQQIPVQGELHTVAKCGKKLANVVIIVANVENSNNLFGLDFFKTFNFEIQQIANVTEKQGTQMTDLCQRYKEVFKPAMGTIKNFKASIYLKPNFVPKFYKSRQIPFAQLVKFKEEAQRLIEAGFLKPIKFSIANSTSTEARWSTTNLWRFQARRQFPIGHRAISIADT